MASIGPRKGWEELLIHQIQEREYMWFPENKNYKNVYMRKKAYSEIGDLLKQSRKSIN